MAARSAQQPWFNLAIKGGPEFGVYCLKGKERLNEPYRFELEMVNRDASVDLVGLLGAQALLSIVDHSGSERLVHGQINEARQLHTANLFTHYHVILGPRLHFLGLNRNHRIFQDMTVPQIIEKILKEQNFLHTAYNFKLKESYPVREYCVQYGESDLHFITRLCEEEGIYFYYAHSQEEHTLCFSDAAGGSWIPATADGSLRFFPGSGQQADTAVISRINLLQKVNSDTASYREWNFTKPTLDLEVTLDEADQQKAPTPGGLKLETYKYPHLYNLREPGDRYANIQLGRQLTFSRWVEGEGNVSRLLPGFAFSMHGHPRADLNAQWWLTEVHHFGEQPQVLEHEAPDRGFMYQARFTGIPFETRFIPELENHKVLIPGQQTAIVTGPPGEEIYPDQYGRVKVEFHWDRLDLGNERSSCWVRVSQGWAGGQYGGMAIPRVGHEVVVSFLEGDPDKPLITGRVYHAENMPPYALPEHKTRTVIRSKTYKGAGFNEIRLEDLPGQEQIFVHGQRDQDIIIQNKRREWIKGERNLRVEANRVEEVVGLASSKAYEDRMEATGTNRTVTVGGDEAHQVGGAYHLKVGGTVFLQGDSGVIEMASSLTLKAPGGFIRIDQGGITILGTTTNINSGGSPGAGMPVQAIPALTAELADSRGAVSGQESASLPVNLEPETPSNDSVALFSSFGGQSFLPETASIDSLFSLSGDNLLGGLGGLAGMTKTALNGMTSKGMSGLLSSLPINVDTLMTAKDVFAQNWRNIVELASNEISVLDKLNMVNEYVQNNVKLTPMTDGCFSNIKGPLEMFSSGTGNALEAALGKMATLEQAGISPESMRILLNAQTPVLAVWDGMNTTVAGSSCFPQGLPSAASAMPGGMAPNWGFNSQGCFSYKPL